MFDVMYVNYVQHIIMLMNYMHIIMCIHNYMFIIFMYIYVSFACFVCVGKRIRYTLFIGKVLILYQYKRLLSYKKI